MLIADDDIKGKPADELQAQSAEAAASAPAPAPPPSYQASVQPPQPVTQPSASSSQQQPILPLHNPPHHHHHPTSYGSTASSESSLHDQRKARKQAKKRALKRFIKAALTAVGIWLLVSIFIKTFVGMVRHSNVSLPGYDNTDGNLPAILPIPSDVERKRCLGVSDFAKTKVLNELQTSFVVSLDDYESLVLFSRGYLSKGYTTIQQSTLDSGDKDARIDVKMVYDENHKELLDDLEICSIERGSRGGRRGVGIFSPTQWPHKHLPSMSSFPTFFITLHIPTNQTFIKKLETDLANHSQLFLIPPPTADHALRFGSLDMKSTNGAVSGEGVRFSDGNIFTSNGRINLKNVECNGCTVHSTNGDIRGTYHARNSLALETSNGALDVNVFLGYDDMEGGWGASATMKTTNEYLKAVVTLLGQASELKSSSYFVTSSTTNAQSELAIPIMPSNSTLHTTSSTTNGKSEVAVPNEFEGKFYLLTTNAKAIVATLGRDDPEGRGRKEHWDFTKISGSQAQGERRWGEEHGRGNVVATTSNEQIKLVV